MNSVLMIIWFILVVLIVLNTISIKGSNYFDKKYKFKIILLAIFNVLLIATSTIITVLNN